MNGRVLSLGLISFCLLLAALTTQSGSLALMALPFLAYLGVGILGAPAPGKIRLTAERLLVLKRTEDGAAADQRVTVRNSGPGISVLLIRDSLQPGMTIVEGDLRRFASLERGKETLLSYTFQAERGVFRWETVRATVSDPFGLFPHEMDLPASAEVLVRPRVKKFRPFPIRPDSTLHSPGLIPARIGGNGTDFWGVREYHPGDPLRRLDWRRNARHPRQLFTMEIEQEEVADIGLVLDARQMNDFRTGSDSLFEHSLDATISLAEVFLRRGNRVGLLIVGDVVTTVYPGYGKVQVNRILRSLAKARPGEGGSRFSLENVSLRPFASHALIVILSPLASDEWQIFPHLRARGNEGLLISPDPIDFMKRSTPQDEAGRLGLRLARVERRLRLRNIAHFGIRVIDWQVARPLSPLVRDALRAARGQRQ